MAMPSQGYPAGTWKRVPASVPLPLQHPKFSVTRHDVFIGWKPLPSLIQVSCSCHPHSSDRQIDNYLLQNNIRSRGAGRASVFITPCVSFALHLITIHFCTSHFLGQQSDP